MKETKVYCLIGKVLCSLSGAIVGFLTGGVYWTLPGAAAGLALASLLEHHLLKTLQPNK